MRDRSESTPDGDGAPAGQGEGVAIFVPDDHPVLRLKRALNWEASTAVMVTHWRAAGKNVDGGPGLPWPVALYVPLLVLRWLKSYHARQMEEYLSESVLAQRVRDLQVARVQPIRDPASIARAEAARGAGGKAAVTALVIHTAQELGFAGKERLSSDTTVQEPAIGYPHEPGILKGWAERSERGLKKLKTRGVQGAQAGIETARGSYHRVKPHHLFATTKAEKQRMLQQIVKKSAELAKTVDGGIKQVSARCGRVKQTAKAKLIQLGAVARTLRPQIKQGMETGKGATEKLLHAGLPQARAIPQGKGRVKFGLKGLIHRLTGGSLFGQRGAPRADENRMPLESVKDYRELFGQQATPKRVVYDRGASLPAAAAQLQPAGVRKVGIPPRGQGTWLVGEKAQKVVKSERGKAAGSIGRLKSRKYGFSHRQERSLETQDAAGQRAIVSVNLNTLLRDLVAQANAAS